MLWSTNPEHCPRIFVLQNDELSAIFETGTRSSQSARVVCQLLATGSSFHIRRVSVNCLTSLSCNRRCSGSSSKPRLTTKSTQHLPDTSWFQKRELSLRENQTATHGWHQMKLVAEPFHGMAPKLAVGTHPVVYRGNPSPHPNYRKCHQRESD